MPWIQGRIIRGQIDGRNVLLSEISGVNNKIESAASDKKSVKQLSFVSVAVMYVGAIMGAGFASGREGWQFFGLFGDKAYIGITLSGVLFILFGMMVSYIARKKGTWDLGRIIVPGDSHLLSEIVGWIVALLLYTIIISMGSLFELTYIIRLKDANDEKKFIDDLRCRNGNLKIICGLVPENRETI